MSALDTWLSQRSQREQLGIKCALGLVLLFVVWQWVVFPALKVLQSSEAQHTRLALQTAQMQAMEQQAKQLRKQSLISPSQAAQSLQSLASNLDGRVIFNRQGQRVTLAIKALSPQALADLLNQIRSQTHAQVQEAQLLFINQAWEGHLLLALPNPL
jgi:general secretion pathway protein M